MFLIRIQIIFFIVLSFLFSQDETRPEDVTGPELLNFTISPNAVDVTESSQTVTITVEASDDISGLDYVSGYFWSPSQQYLGFNLYPSGDGLQHEMTTEVTFDENIESGTWEVQSISISDNVGNWGNYNTESLVDMGFETQVEVTSIQDVTGPELLNFTISSNVVNVTESSQTVTITVEASDDISGLDYVSGYFWSPSQQYLGFNLYPSGDGLQHEMTTEVTFDENIESGTWEVQSISISDNVGNWGNYNTESLVDMGFETQVEVLYGVVSGCTDPYAENYNENAEYEDGSCTYPDNGDYTLSFDGIDDLVELNQSAISSSQNTFSAMFNAAESEHYDFDSGKPIYTQGASSSSYANYAIGLHSDGLYIELDGPSNNGVHKITGPIDFDTWYHLTVVFDTGQISTYLNYNLESVIEVPFSIIIPNNSGGYLGNRWGVENQNNGGYKWNGSIDQVSFWNLALTQEQIQNNISTELNGSEEGLTAYWKFNSGEGDILFDHSGNQNHGVIV